MIALSVAATSVARQRFNIIHSSCNKHFPLFQNTRRLTPQLRALKHALSSAQNRQTDGFPANGGSGINPRVSAIGGINEVDMKARVVNKGDVSDAKPFPAQHQGQQQEAFGKCLSGYAIGRDATNQVTRGASSGNQADTIIAVKTNHSTQPERADGQRVFNDGPAEFCSQEDGACAAKTDEQGRTWSAGAEELLQQPQLHHAANVRLAEVPPPRTQTKARTPDRDLGQEVAAAVTAAGCRRVAEDRVRELEEVLSVSERQHSLFRARAESRLEALKLAFAQEQEEGGAHVRGSSYG